MTIFETRESTVRSYCRSWPTVFDRAAGSWMYDEQGRGYLDFFAGAGALNYGHNNPVLKEALLDYIMSDRVTHSLDMFTVAKRELLTALDEIVLTPRGMPHKVQFTGPTGTNAVEAALKLARKVTGRTGVICFTNAFHGMTLGSLSVTGNAFHRGAAGVPLAHATPMPYDGALQGSTADFGWLDRLLTDPGSGLGTPAAVIVETVQGEGGINVSRPQWLQGLAERCRRHGILLIVDDVQMGCGRTGPFFSFETAGIQPDVICMSKSLSGYGLPFAVLLLKPELDLWQPGEHNGTFRGNNPAFVTAAAALRTYWRDDVLEKATIAKGQRMSAALTELELSLAGNAFRTRGRGLVHGVECTTGELARKVTAAAFDRGLLLETAGPHDEVIKLMPPLTITDAELDHGLELFAEAVRAIY
ncbi:MAG: diaminobutyrate--2-oxoglutarate transaminase [Streptomycetaceae bacterium]|nr:diaminobutyrate--2-oxoglutarate transaminase [Streptomycetaceae bacterium]